MSRLPTSNKALLDEESINASLVVVELRIKIHPTRGMSIEGPIHDKKWCLEVLENAMDAIRNHGLRNELVVPSKDIILP